MILTLTQLFVGHSAEAHWVLLRALEATRL